MDKLEEADTSYVRRVTLVPLVRPVVRAWPQQRQGHLSVGVGQEVSLVLVVVLHLKNGVQRCCVGGVILVEIGKQRVRTNMMNNSIFKLTLSTIAKFQLHA